MRAIAIVFVLLLSIPGAAEGQDWEEFTSTPDGFRINFPGKPRVADASWTSQMNYTLPMRVYSAEKGRERYSLTVVDYSSIEQQGTARAKTCPPGNANCRSNAGVALGDGYARHDERGAIVYAVYRLLQRDARLNYMTWDWQDMVEGHLLQLTNNADQSRTFAWIGMHAHKLYIVEGTVPAGYPEPGLFQQSLGWVDKDGNGIRYSMVYSNSYHGMGVYPVPALAGAARGGAAGAAAAPPEGTPPGRSGRPGVR
jgi:hypothetical protein